MEEILSGRIEKERGTSLSAVVFYALISVEGKKEVSLRKKIKYIKEQIEEGSSLEVLGPIKKFVGGGKISLSLVIKGKKGKLQEELWKFLEDGKIKVSDGLSLVIDPVEV